MLSVNKQEFDFSSLRSFSLLVCNKCKFNIDFDDMMDCATMAYSLAANEYHEKRGSFSTFLFHRIKWEILDFFNRKNLPIITTPLIYGTSCCGKKLSDLKIDLKDQISRIKNDQHRQIFSMYYFQGMNGPEIAAQLGIRKQRVYHVLKEFNYRNIHVS